jgi:hypothetical protein
MFPIAYGPGSIEDRTIEADDIAGITDIYGGRPRTATSVRLAGA